MKENILITIGAIGAFITDLFGGWTGSTTTLFTFIVIDLITGLMLATVFKKSQKTETGTLSSVVGYKGLCRKGMILLYLLIGHQLDIMLGTTYIKDGLCVAFIINELVSITENATLMGFPTPSLITNVIDVLKKKTESSKTN